MGHGRERRPGVAARAVEEVGQTNGQFGRLRDHRLDVLHRAGTWHERRDDPSIGTGERALPESRDNPGRQDARLARPRWTDERDETGAAAQAVEHGLGQGVAPEEVRRVFLAERSQPLVRVAGVDRGLGGGLRRGQETRVVEEDAFLHALQRWRGVQPELLGQQDAQSLVRPQRLGMAAGAIERQHQELARALAEGILADRGVEERQDLSGSSGIQLGGSERFDRVEVEVVETTDVRLRELLVREVGQGGPAPQRVGRPQEVHSPLPIARLDLFASLFDEGLELVRVDGLGRRIELVAGLPGGDEAPTRQRLEGLAQLRDVDLDGVGGGARRIVAPQQVDQPVGRDDFSGVQQQDREQGSLLRRPKVRGDSLGDGFEGTENPELHRCPSSTPGVRARVCVGGQPVPQGRPEASIGALRGW